MTFASRPAAGACSLSAKNIDLTDSVQPASERSQESSRNEAAQTATKAKMTFVRESWAELKKVDWPGQRQVMTGTVVVIIACAIVGTYLWLADLVFQPLVERLLLGR